MATDMVIQIKFPQALDTTGRTIKVSLFLFFATLVVNMAFQAKFAVKIGLTNAFKDFVGMFLIFVVVQCLFMFEAFVTDVAFPFVCFKFRHFSFSAMNEIKLT